MVRSPPAVQETRVQALGWGNPLEKGVTTHSSILAWRTPWMEELVWLQSVGLQETRLSDERFHILWQQYLQSPGRGSNLDAHQQTNGYESRGSYTQWSITQPLKIHLNQF